MEFLLDPNIWVAFAMLTALEIVLGVDNIIFISILVGRLPEAQRDKARRLGLGFAMVSRLALLFSLTWVMGLTDDLFTAFGMGISGRDLVLLRRRPVPALQGLARDLHRGRGARAGRGAAAACRRPKAQARRSGASSRRSA